MARLVLALALRPWPSRDALTGKTCRGTLPVLSSVPGGGNVNNRIWFHSSAVEQRPDKPKIAGSNPAGATIPKAEQCSVCRERRRRCKQTVLGAGEFVDCLFSYQKTALQGKSNQTLQRLAEIQSPVIGPTGASPGEMAWGRMGIRPCGNRASTVLNAKADAAA